MEKALNEILNKLNSLEQGQQELKADIQKVNVKIDKLEVRMENEVIEKTRALFDDRSVNHDYFASIKDSLARMEDRVEFLARQNIEHLDKLQKHDRELRLLRTEKK